MPPVGNHFVGAGSGWVGSVDQGIGGALPERSRTVCDLERSILAAVSGKPGSGFWAFPGTENLFSVSRSYCIHSMLVSFCTYVPECTLLAYTSDCGLHSGGSVGQYD